MRCSSNSSCGGRPKRATTPRRRGGCSREALGLWRGRPFGDLADDEGFRLEAYRLDELRLVAMELSLEADLALGRHELVVGELESSVEEYPYRERLWLLLIEALALGDRRVEALRTCARLRDVLADVGIEPGAEVSALEHRILEGESVSESDTVTTVSDTGHHA